LEVPYIKRYSFRCSYARPTGYVSILLSAVVAEYHAVLFLAVPDCQSLPQSIDAEAKALRHCDIVAVPADPHCCMRLLGSRSQPHQTVPGHRTI